MNAKMIEDKPEFIRYEDDNDIIEIRPCAWELVIKEKDSGQVFDDEFDTREEAKQAMMEEIKKLSEEQQEDEDD